MGARRGFKRIIYRSLEELKATAQIARRTSVKDALSTFLAKADIQIMNRNGFHESPAVMSRLLKKHTVMLEYFEKEFEPFVQHYDFDRPLPDNDPELRDRIWVCWWQGLENAPELVKQCVASIKRSAGDHQVTIITEENYHQYASIPQWIIEKYREGIISRTHFSDILRLCLLAEHGGMWLDATFYCTATLNPYFGYKLWSIKRPDYSHVSVAMGRFATYSLACGYDTRYVFATIRDFLLHYWEKNDLLVDYLVLDYLFVLAQKSDERIANAFAAIEPNNPRCDDLVAVLGQPYDEKSWDDMKVNTALYKLTWKQEYQLQNCGRVTFYAQLIDDSLR